MVHLAFYKAPGTFADKLIRWWTSSPYSHVEMIIDGVSYSSSPRDGRVRSTRIDFNQDHWDFVEIEATPFQKRRAAMRFAQEIGRGYDWLGIVMTQIIPLGVQQPSRWFCSEIVTAVLDDAGLKRRDKKPAWYSPGRLYERMTR